MTRSRRSRSPRGGEGGEGFWDRLRAPKTWWVCLALLALPITIHSTHLVPGLPLMAGGVLSMLAAIATFRGAGNARAFHPGQPLFFLYLVWCAVSGLQSLDAYLSERAVASLCAAGAFVLVARSCIVSGREWRRCAHLFVLLATMISLAAWPEAFREAADYGRFRYVSGVFENRDLFSVIPMFGLTVACALLKERSKALWRLLLVEGVVLAATLVATGCRAAFLGVAVGSVVFAALLVARKNSRRDQLLLAGAGMSVLFGLVLLTQFELMGLERILRSLNTDIISQETQRLQLLRDGPKGALLYPVFGCGPAAFGMAYQKVRQPGFNDHFDLAHNDFIETAVETGIVGALLWLALWVSACHRLTQCYRDRSRSFEACGMAMALVATAVFSCFNFIVSKLPTLWWEVALFSLIWALPPREPAAVRRYQAVGMGVVALILGGWTAVFGVRALVSEGFRAQALVQIEALDLDQAATMMESSVRWMPERTLTRQQAAENYRKLAAFTEDKDYIDRALLQLEAGLEHSPENLAVYLQLADILARAGRPGEATPWLERAKAVAPGSALVAQRQAAVAMQEGDFARAVALLESPGNDRRRKMTLAQLLVAAEIKEPGSTARYALGLSGRSAEDFSVVLDEGVALAQERKLWEPAASLLGLKVRLVPEDLCAKVDLAAAKGQLSGESAEYSALDLLVSQAQTSTADHSYCEDRLLVRWAALGISAGKAGRVRDRLAMHVEEHPGDTLVRAELAKLYLKEERGADAISVLREGLASNPDAVELNQALAEVYESLGSRELALNYYRTTLRLEPQNRTAASRLRLLKAGKKATK